MKRKTIIAVCLLAVLLTGVAAGAERPAPRIVGGSTIRKEAEKPVIRPITFDEMENCLEKLNGGVLGQFVEKYNLETYTWLSEERRTVMALEGDDISITIVVDYPLFGEGSGTGKTSELYERALGKPVVEVRQVTCRSKSFNGLPREIIVGSNFEALLTAYGITEISDEGLIYDNDLLYAAEGSEDSDYAYHPDQHAIIYRHGTRTYIEFTAYQAHSDRHYVLTYAFKSGKIETVTIKKA